MKADTGTRGFTLIELLVVMAIIAVLAGVLIPVFMNMSSGQRRGVCMGNLREIGVGVAQYREDFGHYPPAPAAKYLQSAALKPLAADGRRMPVTRAVCENEESRMGTKVESFGTPPPDPKAIGVGGEYAKETDAYPQMFKVRIVAGDPAATFTWETLVSPAAPTAPVVKYAVIPLGNTGLTLTFLGDTGYTAGQEWRFWGVPNEEDAVSADGPRLVENFGLASLYYLYLTDTKDYMRTSGEYHCPAFSATKAVDRGASVRRLPDEEQGVRFDPLWSGFNNYDIAYNYNQYAEAIADFDAALGQPGLHSVRQLSNTTPPADTVVTWCYAHRAAQTPPSMKPAAGSPVLPLTATAAEIGAAQNTQRKVRDVLLWLDGSAETGQSYLARGADGYYWTPPFLCSRGEWRR